MIIRGKLPRKKKQSNKNEMYMENLKYAKCSNGKVAGFT